MSPGERALGCTAMYALTWRCDGSEGIKWFLRGIGDDGSFYGEIRFQSPHAGRRKASTVAGRLSAAEATLLGELIRRIRVRLRRRRPGRTSAPYRAPFRQPLA